MTFYPQLSKTKDKFEQLPMYNREMQNAAADIGRYVMERMAQSEKEKADGKIQRECTSDKDTGEANDHLRQQPNGG